MKMRKLLPKESYRLMKNRKSPRICRLRKKEVLGKVFENSDDLAKENENLKKELKEAYAKLELFMQKNETAKTASVTPSSS